MHPLIDNSRTAIADVCRRHGVRRLEAFGSILRSESDVDILVEFEPAAAGSFQNFLDLKESLEALPGRSICSSSTPFATVGCGTTSRSAGRARSISLDRALVEPPH
jgi:predicted nucleotidyltransferase